ncbi:hypothetical protein IFM89_025188 [Coptis chinensis]|uniref:Uncharacterized protein n=1 Tax=Coptis chinensis TaxID=261450 RepID=A0A835IB37_9MAGN|nr:hypothetical protein IFM89_025188 [Coptis chinensis]
MEVIELDTDFGSTFSGVLTDDCGGFKQFGEAFRLSTSEDHQFVRGLPVFAISEVLDKIISSGKGPGLLINGIKRPMPLVRILVVELYPTLLPKARSFRLSDDWVQECPNEFQFLKNFLECVFTIDTLVKPLPSIMAYNVSCNLSFSTSIFTQFFDEKGIANAQKSLGLGQEEKVCNVR